MTASDDRTRAGESKPVVRHTSASPAEVWRVLADGWSYPSWVVGAARMRAVDAGWPAPGTRLHHSVGMWPVVTNDDTEVLASETERLLRLRAKAWPLGEATVEIRLAPEGDGTRIEMREDAADGPATLMPQPARQPLIAARNTESLRRLALLAERASSEGDEPAARES